MLGTRTKRSGADAVGWTAQQAYHTFVLDLPTLTKINDKTLHPDPLHRGSVKHFWALPNTLPHLQISYSCYHAFRAKYQGAKLFSDLPNIFAWP